MSNNIQYRDPVKVLEVARSLYDSYEGPLKKEKIMSLTFNSGNYTYTVWDGIVDAYSGVDLFDIKAEGTVLSFIMGSKGEYKATKFKISHAQVSEEETERIVAQINNALAGK